MKVRVVWTGRKAAFVHPLSREVKTAVLMPKFRSSGNVRIFPEGWGEAVVSFQPQTIAGSKEQLTALLGERVASLTHALIAVLRPGESPVTDGERERFWRAFGVPVFEQIVDGSGRLLASECEAHDGLHVVSRELKGFELEGYWVDSTPCGCGKKTARLRVELEKVVAGVG